MKIPPRDADNFSRNPGKKARVIVFYGPDQGLVNERAKLASLSVVADINDPFNAVSLTVEALLDDPARLSDEASAISMMGGDRLIRIPDGADKIAPLLEAYLEAPSDSALVVVQASGLSPKSALRKLAEKADNAAAVACYVEDARDLAPLIQGMMGEQGLRIDRDAVSWLTGAIAGDRQRVRAELEKLILYKSDEPDEPITLTDAQAVCGESGEAALDALVYAVADRRAEAALREYSRLLQEGVAFIAMLRALQTHFKKLHYGTALLADGASADQAMKSMSPPIFFKQQPAFRAQLQNWRSDAVMRALCRLAEVEAECKKTGAAVETLCGQLILGLSHAPGRRRAA